MADLHTALEDVLSGWGRLVMLVGEPGIGKTRLARELVAIAERGGYQVFRKFVDEAESGRTSDRLQFQQMVAEARRASKPFQIIQVWKYSRFARSREDAILFKSLIKKHGVRVVSITEPLEDSPTGKLLEAIIERLDEFYSATRPRRCCGACGRWRPGDSMWPAGPPTGT